MSLQLALLETEEKVASNEIPSEEAETRLILDHLLIESQLYTSSKDYIELFDFAIRMRNLSPFNAMLVQIQKPGLIYVASAYDWQNRFERSVKNRARPLLILWPFGPIALVYDVDDTEGKELPDDVFSFLAKGSMTIERINSFIHNLQRKNFEWIWFDGGDADAGSIGLLHRSSGNKEYSRYRISVNKNHNSNQQFEIGRAHV